MINQWPLSGPLIVFEWASYVPYIGLVVLCYCMRLWFFGHLIDLKDFYDLYIWNDSTFPVYKVSKKTLHI